MYKTEKEQKKMICTLFNETLAKNSIRATGGRGPLPLKKVLQNFKDRLGLSICNKLGPETQACPYTGKWGVVCQNVI